VKRIVLRVIPDDRFAPDTPEYAANTLDWSEAIRQVIRRPLDPQRGASIDELRKGIRVFDALDRANGTNELELEDADWEHLREKTQGMQWAFVDRRVLAFIEDVLSGADP
jgi:hypothetical protein